MFKASSIPFIGPNITSKTRVTGITGSKVAPISWQGVRSKSKSGFGLGAIAGGQIMPVLCVTIIASVVGLMVLHLFWVNTYSSKGFELERAQIAIQEQTEIQKKLLVKQSLMSSTVSLSDLSNTGLVPVTESETLNGNIFAQAK